MSGAIWNLLSFIVALGVLITVHEFGHFWVARKNGILVQRFSIGFGKMDDVYAISVESPLGALLKGKKIGESVEMRGKKITIKSIR